MQNAECRIQHTVSRIMDHASHATLLPPRASRAFTLIELLVVISVIALLAALTFPAIQGVKRSAIRTRAKGELTQLETAIERFNQKLGYYPADNPANWALNQLYYELLGTTNVGTVAAPVYITLDGSAQINAAGLNSAFGANVTGFANCSRPARSDDVPGATAFVDNLKPTQFLAITNGSSPTPICSVLGTTLDGPLLYQNGNGVKLNPWRYNSSNPHYNPKSFDLWIDVAVGNQTNRICNWSDKPLKVGSLYP
jgi:prepilin-type N-terminal cleavage/methylation domain-containing protein